MKNELLIKLLMFLSVKYNPYNKGYLVVSLQEPVNIKDLSKEFSWTTHTIYDCLITYKEGYDHLFDSNELNLFDKDPSKEITKLNIMFKFRIGKSKNSRPTATAVNRIKAKEYYDVVVNDKDYNIHSSEVIIPLYITIDLVSLCEIRVGKYELEFIT
jgi:hypothetical protein